MFGRRQHRPTDREAAARLLILRQVALVGVAMPTPEQQREDTEGLGATEIAEYRKEIEGNWADTWRELEQLGLTKSMSGRERALAATSPWELTTRQRIDASWRVESVQALLWAFGAMDHLPPYDSMSTHDVLDMVPVESGSAILATARLRPEAEIDQARDAAELWHWRSRTRDLMESGASPGAGDLGWDDIVSGAADAAVRLGMFEAPVGGDFPAFGKPYRELEEQERDTIRSITTERHTTLKWLCGFAPGNDWDKTPTDT
jgi:hypothetical protein